jgi:hypothetical protein
MKRKLTLLFVFQSALCSLFFSPALCHADAVADCHTFERAVRDGTLSRTEAVAELPPLITEIHSEYASKISSPSTRWTFPVQGYGINALDRHDYKPLIRYGPHNVKGYDFFDGNKHGGHPAYDIFIHDKNQDTLDDRTGKPVNVVAMTDAVVVSVCREWPTNKQLRGGNYVWLYNPSGDLFFYYAHLNDVTVEEGTLVKAGDPVGTIGRTGVLASRKASPTHVHLMVLHYQDGKMLPVNYYQHLKREK